MLSSHKAVRPRGLHSSSARSKVSKPSSPNLQPNSSTVYHPSNYRDFSWGAKHKTGNKDAGKVWKGFSTQDHTRALKQLYRGTIWNHHYTPHLRRYLPLQDWRLSSSWGKPGSAWIKSDEPPSSNSKNEQSTEEDWYRRYQLQKKKHYNDFMKKMEEDPVGMLFGRTWANWIEGTEAKIFQGSGTKTQEEERTSSDGWPSNRERPRADYQKPAEGRSVFSQREDTSKIVESKNQEYEIDPITNRKVLKLDAKPKVSNKPEKPITRKISPGVGTSVRDQTQNTQPHSQIPVKRFIPINAEKPIRKPTENCDSSSAIEEMNSGVSKPQQTPDWLAKEGFASRQESELHKQPIYRNTARSTTVPYTKLESALDRHLQVRDSKVQNSDRRTPQYKPKEDTTEDLDLLRSSDVRASAGLRGRAPKQSEVEKQTRQSMLEVDYDSGSLRREKELAQEISESPQQKCRSTTGDSKDNQHQASHIDSVNHISMPPSIQKPADAVRPSIQAVSNGKADKIKAQIVPLKARLDAMKADYDSLRQRWLDEKRRKEAMAAKKIEDIHKAEVKGQKVAMEAMETRPTERSTQDAKGMEKGAVHDTLNTPAQHLQSYIPGEGDVASNVHEFANRERWYKKKAPHAKDEMDMKLRKLASDQALIREVREIYEQTYGIIEKDHCQPNLTEDSSITSNTSEACKPTTCTTLPQAFKADEKHHQLTSATVSHTTPSTANQAIDDAETISSQPPLNNTQSSDPLATIQRLFDALRQAQSLVREHRNHLQQLANPSKSQFSSISESSNALAIVQKLFDELRKAQIVIQDKQATGDQISDPINMNTSIQSSKAYNQSLKEIVKAAWELVSMNQSLPKEELSNTVTASETAEQSYFSVISDSNPTNSAFEDVKSSDIYRILAYDWTGQKVISSKATSVTPFSKEEPLLLAEALKLLNNPGKFLPDLMALHKEGYTVVSGNEKTLVLKRPATPEEVEQAECEEVSTKDLYCVDETTPNRTDYLASKSEGISQLPSTPEAASESPSESQSASESAGPSSADSATSHLDSPASESNLPPSEKVRREEAVFSGPSRGNWQEAETKRLIKKTKRSVKRAQKLKNMLLTGTLTAGCCYAVGVISQMLQH